MLTSIHNCGDSTAGAIPACLTIALQGMMMPCDYKKYPADWKAISKRIRFERAGNKCEWCSAPNGKWIQRNVADPSIWMHAAENGLSTWHDAIKVVLTVAHLDHDTTNNDDSNLAALCQRCHLRYDAKLHASNAAETRRRKRGEQPLPFKEQ